MNQFSSTAAVTLSANPLVEKCLAKLANEVTEQVRDKIIDILIAVLTRKCEDFDGESVRRLLVTELETTPLTFALEKRAGPAKTLKEPKTQKTKVVELDADGNPIKKVRTPKEPKEKAPKAPKPVLTEEEREARKAAKKAEKDAEREAAKAAKQAEKEAAPVVAKEQRLPIPWCGKRIEGRCEALRVYHGLFAQCTSDATEISAFCPSCEKSGAKFGTCGMRAACGLFDYTDPSGKKCLRLANIVDKFGVEGGLEAFIAEAAKHDISLPAEHLDKEVKQRGRPKSASPIASKVATTDSGSETETDDEEHQQKRKQVTKVASAAEAPKKRGRPAKNPKSDVTPSDEVIQDLVASAAAMSVSSAPSTPVAAANKPSAETPAAPKKAKAVTLRKPAQRKTRTINEQVFWVDTFNGAEILIRQEDNATFEASNGEPLGFWDDATKTIIECDDDEDEE